MENFVFGPGTLLESSKPAYLVMYFAGMWLIAGETQGPRRIRTPDWYATERCPTVFASSEKTLAAVVPVVS